MSRDIDKTKGLGEGDEPKRVTGAAQSSGLEFTALSQQMRGLEGDGRNGKPVIERARALRGIANIIGPRAIEVGHALNYLDARSRTFNGWILNARSLRKLFIVRTTFGDADSFASIGQRKKQDEEDNKPATNTETVLLNLTQTFGTRYGVLGLVAHEFGHAAGGLRDGAPGTVGPNQEAQARVLAEAGLGDGGLLPYGQDLGGPGCIPHSYILIT
jgi:hypothetical protein